MPHLLVISESSDLHATIGGTPLAHSATRWPSCRSCSSAMQFLAQLPLESISEAGIHTDQTLLLFQCQADPGLCDEWDAQSGGNAALLVDTVVGFRLPCHRGIPCWVRNHRFDTSRMTPLRRVRRQTTHIAPPSMKQTIAWRESLVVTHSGFKETKLRCAGAVRRCSSSPKSKNPDVTD